MSFAILITNGCQHSDFTGWTVACCDTEKQAKKAVNDFKSWQAEFLLKYGKEDWEGHFDDEKLGFQEFHEDSKWDFDPLPPFGAKKFEFASWSNFGAYECFYIPVQKLGD